MLELVELESQMVNAILELVDLVTLFSHKW
jgi:hypothetical protein